MLAPLVYFNMHTAGPRRLTTIDESASILSDISYDKTDDSLVSTPPVIDTFTLGKEKHLLGMFEVPLSCCSPPVSGLGLFQCENGATEEKGEEGGFSRHSALFHSLSSISIVYSCLIVFCICIYLLALLKASRRWSSSGRQTIPIDRQNYRDGRCSAHLTFLILIRFRVAKHW